MTKEEYKSALEEINQRYEKEKNEMEKKYALANTKFREGDDVIYDGMRGVIYKITVYGVFEKTEIVHLVKFTHTEDGKKLKQVEHLFCSEKDLELCENKEQ